MKRFRKSVIGVLAALLLMSFVIPGAAAVEPMAGAAVGSPLAPAAATADGWKQNGGYWYYYENGVMATGWKMVGGAWYYFRPSGNMATGWVLTDYNVSWYYFDESGRWISSLGACPSWAPVKGNRNGVTYHLPEQQSYGWAVAKVCFGTAADAESKGYQPAEK